MSTKTKRSTPAKTQTFPAGGKGIVKAVATAKKRGERQIIFVLPKKK